MNRWLWLLCLSVAGQTAPAEFESLTITIQMAGASGTERWEGAIRYGDTPALPMVKYLPVHAAGPTGAAAIREFRLSNAQGQPKPAQPGPLLRNADLLTWAVDAAPGDRLHFVVEQPVAASGLGLIGSRPTAFPVKQGRLVLRAPGLHVPGGATEFPLVREAREPYFVATPFGDWAAFRTWLARCSMKGDPRIRQMARGLKQRPLRGLALAEAAAERLAAELPVRNASCLETNAWDAQAALVALLEEVGLRAERWVAGGKKADVEPMAMTRALVRVEGEWLDAARLAEADGLPAADVAGLDALRVDGPAAVWQRVELGEGKWTGTLKGVVGKDGRLRAEYVGQVTGAFRVRTSRGRPEYTEFVSKRRLRGVGSLPGQFFIDETNFLSAIRRSTPLEMLLVPMAQPPRIRGVYVEEIELELPENYTAAVERNLDEERPYAHYRSTVSSKGGRLQIRRELEVKETAFPLGAAAFWKLIGDDQKRAITIARNGPVDRQRVMAEVGEYPSDAVGLEAYNAQEYDLAVELFRAVIARDGRSRYAWNNLGRALAALDRLDEAQAAYEKQIEINPSDAYAYNNLGLLLQRRKQWGKATDAFMKQLWVNPKDQYAVRNLPEAAFEAGRWTETLVAVAEATRPGAPDYILSAFAAGATICLGRTADARATAFGALRPGPSAPGKMRIARALSRCGKELPLASELLQAAAAEWETVREGSLSGRDMPSAFAYQLAIGDYLQTKARIERQTGKNSDAEADERAAAELLEEAPGDIWLPVAANGERAPANWTAGVPAYVFVVTADDGIPETVNRLSQFDVNAPDAFAVVRRLPLPVVVVEGFPVRTANVLKLERREDGTLSIWRARRYACTDVLRAKARDRFPQTRQP